MNEYKFVHFKNNSNELYKFIKKHGVSINRIIKSCFDVNYCEYDTWILKYDIFCLMFEKKVVAFASTQYKDILINTKNVNIYEYVKVDSDNMELINDSNNNNKVLLGPFIESLCRDMNPKYKGVGTILLKYISDYYKNKGVEKIYLVPESTKYKKYGQNDNCGVEIDKDKYLDSQKSLHKFYNNFGFYKLDNHYEFDLCDSNYPSFIFYPVFYKKLN